MKLSLKAHITCTCLYIRTLRMGPFVPFFQMSWLIKRWSATPQNRLGLLLLGPRCKHSIWHFRAGCLEEWPQDPHNTTKPSLQHSGHQIVWDFIVFWPTAPRIKRSIWYPFCWTKYLYICSSLCFEQHIKSISRKSLQWFTKRSCIWVYLTLALYAITPSIPEANGNGIPSPEATGLATSPFSAERGIFQRHGDPKTGATFERR